MMDTSTKLIATSVSRVPSKQKQFRLTKNIVKKIVFNYIYKVMTQNITQFSHQHDYIKKTF